MPRLPVLMYHNVKTEEVLSIGLTISLLKLKEQLNYLVANNYRTLHFKDLQNLEELPKKAVIITFDDVYVSQYELVYPLLKKDGLKACFYVPFNYVGAKDNWNTGQEAIMNLKQLKAMDSNIVELGLHSFAHDKYDSMSLEATQKDLALCDDFIKENNLEISRVLAYPYGKFPRKGEARNHFFELLKKHHINYGLRIGNRVNRYPFKNKFEVQRIDIKGEDSLAIFKRKLKYGKLRLF